MERWETYAMSLESQLNLIQINLRGPVVRIQGLAELLRTGGVDSEEEKLELLTYISQQAEEVLEYLKEISFELDRKKKELGREE